MRLMEQGGLHGLWLTLIMYGSALVLSLPIARRGLAQWLKSPEILTPLALAAGWTNVSFILAILEGNVLRVLLLFYLSPLWAVIMAWCFLGERPNKIAWATLIVAMFGALSLLWSPELEFPWPSSRADWLALSSGLAFALSNIFIRKGQQVGLEGKLFSTWVGVMVLACALLLWHNVPVPDVSVGIWVGATSLGLMAIVMTASVQFGVTSLPVHRSAVILLFELVVGAVSQQLLTEEKMLPVEWLGGALIVAAAYISARSTKN